MKSRNTVKEFATITIGTAIVAAAVFFFMLPSHVAVGSGATLNEIIGAYDKTPKMEMVTIVDKNEYRRLMDFVRKTDPKAFVTVYSVSDMRYQPKKKNK